MLVLGARAAAGAGSCAGARGSARFNLVVVRGCSLVAVPARGVAPGRGSGCGRWWALSPRVVCGVSRGGAGGGGGVQSRRGAASFLCWWAVVSHVPGRGRGVRCGMVVLGNVVAFPVGGGGTVSRSVGAGGRSWLVLGRWGAPPVRSLGCPSGVIQYVGRAGSLWCGAWGPLGRRVCGIGVSEPGGCGCVVLWGVRPPLSGPSGVGCALYGV